MTCFEACSAFTRVAARMLAEPPKAVLLIEVLQTTSLPPSSAPSATGWSDSCRAGLAPAREWRLTTAHSMTDVMSIVRREVDGLGPTAIIESFTTLACTFLLVAPPHLEEVFARAFRHVAVGPDRNA